MFIIGHRGLHETRGPGHVFSRNPFIHKDLREAQIEAERLSANNPGNVFRIFHLQWRHIGLKSPRFEPVSTNFTVLTSVVDKPTLITTKSWEQP